MRGLVVKNTGSWYVVHTADGRTVNCKAKGTFRLKGIRSTNPIVIGDWVEIGENQGDTAYVKEICKRRNYMIRRSTNLSKQSHILAANLDLAILVITVNYPQTSTVFIDRFLATAEAYRIPILLLFNKKDRYNAEEAELMDALIHLYNCIGYRCMKMCAITSEGIDELKEILFGKISLFSGHSGVGKSTIINQLLPNAKLKTNEISEYHKKGMHTTTFSEMIPLSFDRIAFLPRGGYVIDTPGIKGFGTLDMEGAEISHYFKEIFQFSADCHFNNCTHRNEPGCAVLKAVDERYISESRYKSYLNIMDDKDSGKYREAY